MEVVMAKKMPSIPAEDLNRLREALATIYVLEDKHSVTLMHNYAWREWLQLLEAQSHFDGLRLISGTHGADAEATNHSKIEFKSCKSDPLKKSGKYSQAKVKFEFDKQDKPQRRAETLEYDGFVFAGFDKYANVVWSVLAQSKASVNSVRVILRRKQDAFIKLLNEVYKAKGKESRDTIAVNYDDLMSISNAIYKVNGNEVTKEQFKTFFIPPEQRTRRKLTIS
tara:strand:+ start:39 stop:710 length:672 start_codon:yes stop_codon:yes gene_type:complete